MKKNNGFTLIEVLAVIVVLSIILVIATSVVTGNISNSRNSAFMTSFDNLIDDVRKHIVQNKSNKNVQVECITKGTVDGGSRWADLPSCSTVYGVDENEYRYYVMQKEGMYFIYLEGIGKFQNVNLNKYAESLFKENIYLVDHNWVNTNNSMFTVLSKTGETIKYDFY